MIDLIFKRLDLYFNKYRLRRLLILYIPGAIITSITYASIIIDILNKGGV